MSVKIGYHRAVGIIIVLGISLLYGTGCDSNSDPGMSDNFREGRPLYRSRRSVVKNGFLEVGLYERGFQTNGFAGDQLYSDNVLFLALGGPWIYSNQDRPRALLSSTGPLLSNMVRSIARDSTFAGVYTLTQDSLDGPISNWPSELGAPSLSDGQPRLYGDMMAWAHFEADVERFDNVNSFPATDFLTDIEIGMSLYMFTDESVNNAFFVRFDIQNTGSAPVNDLIMGYQTDTDLVPQAIKIECDISHTSNATGYMSEKGISYTYIVERGVPGGYTDPAAGSNITPACFGYVSGYAFLQSPVPNERILSHSIIRRRPNGVPAGFYEGDFQSMADFGRILNGLSLDGQPMTDPTTGQTTRFAFAGNPVAGTGWLDTAQDVRSLLSLEPFSIEPGATETVTVVFVVGQGANLSEGIDAMESTIDFIRSHRDRYVY